MEQKLTQSANETPPAATTLFSPPTVDSTIEKPSQSAAATALFSPPTVDSFPKGEALGTTPKAFPSGEGGPQGRKRSSSAEDNGSSSPTARLLLLAALVVGVAFRLGWGDNAIAAWGGWYGAFWLIAMLAVTPFIWRRAVKSRTGLACGVAAAALCCLQMARASAAVADDLALMQVLGIPVAMLLYLVFSAYDVPVGREGAAARLALSSVFVYPFTGVPRFFAALFSLFRGRGRAGDGRWKRVLAGLAIGLPIAAGALLLLIRADANMEALFSGLLRIDWDTLVEARNTVLVVCIATMLFYGVFERAARADRPALPDRKPASWPAATMSALLLPPLMVYAVFVVIQFGYLFGGALPVALTYSTYARQGFTEMNLVAAINFTLFGLTLRYGKPHRTLTALCALLLAATGGILISCVWRLLLYIGAYGLTIRRILPLWFAVFLVALTALCAVRLGKGRFPVLRVSGLAFLYWFVALNIPDWTAIIRAYNMARGLG